MDYVVGSVAALISGNVTPNRPKSLKRALTPMKHQPSPNVTPKSESVVDRSIFLSPTMQKKKAIVKKSPKRIFQNPDLEANNENDSYLSSTSPKAEKVKKHLKNELDADIDSTKLILSPKSPKNKMNKALATTPSKNQLHNSTDNEGLEEIKVSNESTPKKTKKKLSLASRSDGDDKIKCNSNEDKNSNADVKTSIEKNIPKKKRMFNVFTIETINSGETQHTETVKESSLPRFDKSNKKIKKKSNDMRKGADQDVNLEVDKVPSLNKENKGQVVVKKNKKRKKNTSNKVQTNLVKLNNTDENVDLESVYGDNIEYVNPNAITNEDTDSEHESDDDIQSENEETNKAVLGTEPQVSSDDEEETDKKEKKPTKPEFKEHMDTEEEVKRTLFVGNVPFSSKCKKEIKRIFSKYGEIKTIRIRTVPVKDGRVTPKLAVIKNELHPDRSTVNVYIKYAHPSSVDDALAENNTVLNNNHLRVARSNETGSEHDPKCSVFIGNLPFTLEDETLRAKFEKCGEIESVRIVRDRKTNAGKGFGYVNFTSKDGVELALALTEEDLTIKNRILRVKRCTQPTTNQLSRQQSNQGRQQTYQARQQNYQQHNFQGRQQNYQQQNYQGRQQNYQGRHQGRYFNIPIGSYDRDSQPNLVGRNQFGNNKFQRTDHRTDGMSEGAQRRIMKKRKLQGSSEGPPQKRFKDVNQPNKEKKPRNEFVGITADKKKFQKRKLNKDQRQKKALSEILTKNRQ